MYVTIFLIEMQFM